MNEKWSHDLPGNMGIAKAHGEKTLKDVRATPTALLFLLWRPFRTSIVEK